jgi:hypothetical protein
LIGWPNVKLHDSSLDSRRFSGLINKDGVRGETGYDLSLDAF